ncbi:MAG: hypothetical protein NC311_15705 [Muribaculaceae bacterium]|nr:hypothetical protein [Muribaculaceae bacterium]
MTNSEKVFQCEQMVLSEMALVIEGGRSVPAAKLHVVSEGFPKDMVDEAWRRLSEEIVAMVREQKGGPDGKMQD